MIAVFAVFYVVTAFALGYGVSDLGYERQALLGVQLISIVFFAMGILIAGWWCDKASPRVVKIPLFDPTQKLDPGKKPIVFNNFTDFFIEGMQGKDVIGRFLYASGIGVGTTGTGGSTPAPLLFYVHLVE